MKKLLFSLSSVAAFAFFSITLFAQQKEHRNPFAKGTWNTDNRTNAAYTNYNIKGFKGVGKTSEFSLSVNPKYFILDHVGVGVDVNVNTFKDATSLTSAMSFYIAYLNLTYGTVITDKVNIFVTVGAGPGSSKFTRSNNTNNTSKYFGVYGTVGVPLALQGGLAYITPYAKYNYQKTNLSSSLLIKNKSMGFGFKVETYFDAGNLARAAKNKERLYEGMYDKGRSFVEFNSMCSISFSTNNQKQVGSTAPSPDQKTTTLNLQGGYQYYFLDKILAGGINFSVKSDAEKSLGSPAMKTSTLIIEPIVTAQVPVQNALQNLFLQAGYGFGQDKDGPNKISIGNIRLWAGYNFFIAKNISLTPKIGYQHNKEVLKTGGSSGSQHIEKGLAAEVGIRTWLNPFR